MSFNAAISTCEKGQQWQQALGMLSEMEYKHLEPNVISFKAAGRGQHQHPAAASSSTQPQPAAATTSSKQAAGTKATPSPKKCALQL